MGEVLTWLSEDGFPDFVELLSANSVAFDYASAAEFRQRHVVGAIVATLTAKSWA